MIRLLITIATVVIPLATWAQTVPVRSGEHGSFTRLVFDLPSPVTWTLEPVRDAKAYRLVFERDALDFDTSAVFARISRERVSSIIGSPEQSSVDIMLACNCVAEAFLASERMLVVDIRAASEPEQIDVAEDSVPAVVTNLSSLHLGEHPRIGPEKRARPLVAEFRLGQDMIGDPQFDRPSQEAQVLAGRLLRDVAQAASLGLLETAAQKPEQPEDNGEAGPGQPLGPVQAPTRLAASLADLNTQTSADGAVSIGGLKCTPDDALNVAAWSKEPDISTAMAAGRGALFEEFDRASPDAIEALARTLLHFGFGAETRATLAISPADAPPLLTALSYVVDGEEDPTGFFGHQLTCTGAVALWSVLSASGDFDPASIDQEGVARAFESLPRHLREAIGPRLAERYASASEPAAAADILRRLERTLGGSTDEIDFGKAKVAVLDGDTSAAREMFADLAMRPGPQSPDALVEAIEIARMQDQSVDRDFVELSEAFAKELKDSEQGAELWQAHIRALLANGAVEDALNALDDAPLGTTGLVTQTQTEVAEAAVHATSDAVFLRLALTGRILPPETEKSRLVHELARRLLDLGIADAALDRLNGLAPADHSQETALLKAEALLALNRATEAEILLIGRQDPPAVELRAAARAAMGDHAYAQTLYGSLDAQEQGRKAARMAGLWRTLDGPDDGALARAAALGEGPELDGADIRLSAVEALSLESAETRRVLEELLVATDIAPVD